MGWNSFHQPRSNRICDWDKCLSSEIPGDILPCGHGYHPEYLVQTNQHKSRVRKLVNKTIKLTEDELPYARYFCCTNFFFYATTKNIRRNCYISADRVKCEIWIKLLFNLTLSGKLV
jgi:hypothetical protein